MKAVSATLPFSSITSPAKRGCLGMMNFLYGQAAACPLLVLFAFHSGEQDSCCKAKPMIETLASIHSEINIQLIAEGVEALFEIGHALIADGNVIVLRQPRAQNEAAQERQSHAVF